MTIQLDVELEFEQKNEDKELTHFFISSAPHRRGKSFPYHLKTLLNLFRRKQSTT